MSSGQATAHGVMCKPHSVCYASRQKSRCMKEAQQATVIARGLPDAVMRGAPGWRVSRAMQPSKKLTSRKKKMLMAGKFATIQPRTSAPQYTAWAHLIYDFGKGATPPASETVIGTLMAVTKFPQASAGVPELPSGYTQLDTRTHVTSTSTNKHARKVTIMSTLITLKLKFLSFTGATGHSGFGSNLDQFSSNQKCNFFLKNTFLWPN